MDEPIGILDSGSGGLTIWKEIVSLFPYESTVYIGDHAHMPYSKKSMEYIRARVIKLIQFLLQLHAKIIVIACNTATVAGIEVYRKKFPQIPIIGVVPVIKTAAAISRTRHIAILSTTYTSVSEYQKNLIHAFASECIVTSIGSTRLVSLIEKGESAGSDIIRELTKLLSEIKQTRTDVLVLGCTHYPFVRNQIRAIVGENITILDSGEAVARQTRRILEKEQLLSQDHAVKHQFYTTGNEQQVSLTMSQLLGRKITIEYVTV